jgi:2-polyprenyl-3-methyl-5-hydroxy-6-metoxy-1,4-benzoquinol methylase
MNQRCPLCNNEHASYVYQHLPQFTDADILKCNNCGHWYSVVRGEIDWNELYADEIYRVVENRNSIFDRIIQNEYKGVLHHLDKITTRKGTLLDFGCGKGKFGSLAQEDGWLVKAVETSPDRAAYARTVYGLDVHTEFYSSGSIFHMQFDALTLFHVLEHLPRPRPILQELIKNNVAKKGIVVIEVPNVNSWQSQLARDKWIHLDVPRHIHHFTPENLEKFVLELGLVPVKKTFFSFHLGVLGMVDSLLKLSGYKKSIIYELKNKKSKLLLLKIVLLLPLAMILEFISSRIGKGGVIRIYSRRNQPEAII